VPLTVAIMQPYFLPYAGYFRLISESDLFVIYDCVQFPRRGWVHRNELTDAHGVVRWLTLPLKGAPREVLIRDLEFASGAGAEMAERLRPFAIDRGQTPGLTPVLDRLEQVDGRPVDYIVDLLEQTCAYLGLRWNVIRSSSLEIPETLRGQDRIVEIASRLGAGRYLNAPGGRELYAPAAFAERGIELAFLPPYEGKGGSILDRMLHEDREGVRASITPLPA
jgi:hypothetical protein